MARSGKRILAARKAAPIEAIDALEAFSLIKKNAKDFESVDVVFNLGIDGKKSDQVVKGVLEVVPAGLGKSVSIGVFANGDINAIKAAGAQHVGMEDLVAKIKESIVDCDVYIASMEAMPVLAKMGLGRILKGKMPNPKLGTVVENEKIVEAVKAQVSGRLPFRSNGSLVHASIGRATFSAEDLFSNYQALFAEVIKSRPTAVKEHMYLKNVYCSSTMGPSFHIIAAKAKGGK